LAVRAPDTTSTTGKWRAEHFVDAEEMKAKGGARDVDDSIDLSNFMKCDLIGRHAVYSPFCLREPAIDLCRHGFNRIGEMRRAKNLKDVAKFAMRDAFVMMSVMEVCLMVVCVIVMRVMLVRVTVADVISLPAVFARHVHVEMKRSEPTLVNALGAQLETVHRQFTQLTLERISGQTGVNERAHDHVAART